MNTSTNKAKTAITPTRSENYAEWYQQVIKAADLAEVSPVRGCMTIKPWGYALWENIQAVLDKMIKATGHKNLYFPLMIPLSFFQKKPNISKVLLKNVRWSPTIDWQPTKRANWSQVAP